MSSASSAEMLEPGRRLGPYQIRAKLGQGGMGQVYEALDTRLNRVVALKVLARKEPGGALKEAQAASALNHPNIVTVYEVGREEGFDFIAMELVRGETIARRGSRLALRDGLRYAVQVADALAAAHACGIVHRDLKPGNIMVTDRGLAKVLDFGIAKMSSVANPDSADTQTMTIPGRVTGTVAYMSPEQAEGKDTDARSDIFSFGCVLYELATGRRAFEADSQIGTLAAVVARDPQALGEVRPDLPAGLVRVIDYCLRKKREDRWQSMSDVKLLLEGLLADPAITPIANAPRSKAWLMLPVAALAGAVGVWWLGQQTAPRPEVSTPLNRATMTTGLNAYPALSRDGHLLAFATDRSESGNLDIWLQQIGSREPVRLTSDPADDTEPAISPDGAHIAFRSERAAGGIYVVPTLGGDAVLLAPRGRSPRYSPDGRWIAYWEGRESYGALTGSAQVFAIEAGGGPPRQLGASLTAALFPVWSPDSKSVLALARGPADKDADWWVLPVDGSEGRRTGALSVLGQQRLLPVPWQPLLIPQEWRASGVLFTASRRDAGNLWEVPIPPGRAVEITRGPGYHMQASAAANGLLTYASLDWKNDLWSLPIDADRGKPLGPLERLTGYEADAVAPGLSRDGARLVYRSRALGRYAIRERELASGKQTNLVESAAQLGTPRIGGETIVYCDRDGDIFRVSRGGGPAEKLCAACGTTTGISADGARLMYEPIESEDLIVFDIAGRTKTIAAKRPEGMILTAGQFSPDSRWVAFEARSARSTSQVFVARIDGALPVPREQWIAVTDASGRDAEPAWSPDGNLLYFLSDRDGFRCIWARALDAAKAPKGPAFAVRHFHTARQSLQRIPHGVGFAGLAVAPGRLVISFGELTGNLWLEERR